MKKLLILLIITFFISCNNTEDKFIGIWMGDRENFYNPNEENSENISLTQGLPILLDFKKENNLTLKIFGAKTFENIKWRIENDSLLNINNIKYKIRKVTKDTICLELYTRAENYDYKIYRIKNKKIELDSTSVIEKLTTEIWSNLKEYSKNNFENFKKTVLTVTQNYKILKPYWLSIDKIINSNEFKNINEKRHGGNHTKFKERIKERMEMFYGLLKRGMEQRRYNKEKFHFSDYELAYMTLWSMLNEISELKYDKIDKEHKFELIDKIGGTHYVRPIPGYNWKLFKTDKYLINIRFENDFVMSYFVF